VEEEEEEEEGEDMDEGLRDHSNNFRLAALMILAVFSTMA
jgi:hypothetical protein